MKAKVKLEKHSPLSSNLLYYRGTDANFDPELARDIITLYVTCSFGPRAIQHVLGLPCPRPIYDVLSQHNLCLNDNVDACVEFELHRDTSRRLQSYQRQVVYAMIKKYSTADDSRVVSLLTASESAEPDAVQTGHRAVKVRPVKVTCFRQTFEVRADE